MGDYTIILSNKSGEVRVYFLFVDAPEVSGSPDKLFQNVYIASPVDADKTATFPIYKDIFAITGRNPGQALGSNVKVTTEDFGIARLCTSDTAFGSAFTMSAVAPFDPSTDGKSAMFDNNAQTQDCKQRGAYSIACKTNFQWGNGTNQFIGLGARNPNQPNSILPLAVFLARPGTNNIITPRSTYYISWSTWVPGQIIDSGQIIDVKTIPNPAPVDFTGKAATLANVVHKPDGTWAVTFS